MHLKAVHYKIHRITHALKRIKNDQGKVIVQYQGRDMCLSEACELAGMKYSTIRARMKMIDGVTFEEALRADRKEAMLGWRRFLNI